MPFALRNSIVGDTEAMELSWACIFKIVSCASRRFLLISVYIDVQLYGLVICLTWEMASWKCFEKLVFEIHIDFRGVAWDFEGVRKGEKVRREPFSIYGGEETMHLLMTTYRQDVMPIFQGSFSKSVYISVLVNRSFHAKEQFYYSIVQIFLDSDINHMYVFDSHVLILNKFPFIQQAWSVRCKRSSMSQKIIS